MRSEMQHQALKSKTKSLLQKAESIRVVFEKFSNDVSKVILPYIRESVVDAIESIEQQLEKECREQMVPPDPLLPEPFEEETFVRAILIDNTSRVLFDLTKIDKDIVDEFLKLPRQHVRYARPEIFLGQMSQLKRRILDGLYDGKLSQDPSVLMYDAMTPTL